MVAEGQGWPEFSSVDGWRRLTFTVRLRDADRGHTKYETLWARPPFGVLREGKGDGWLYELRATPNGLIEVDRLAEQCIVRFGDSGGERLEALVERLVGPVAAVYESEEALPPPERLTSGVRYRFGAGDLLDWVVLDERGLPRRASANGLRMWWRVQSDRAAPPPPALDVTGWHLTAYEPVPLGVETVADLQLQSSFSYRTTMMEEAIYFAIWAGPGGSISLRVADVGNDIPWSEGGIEVLNWGSRQATIVASDPELLNASLGALRYERWEVGELAIRREPEADWIRRVVAAASAPFE